MNNSSFEMNNLLNHLTDLIAEKVSQRIIFENESEKTDSDNTDTEFLNTSEALKVLKIKSKVTLRSYVLAGLIPKPKRIGGRKLVYKKSDLLKFLGDGK
jgi:predicted DNA-binding transcriptional regulator AlpA